MGFLTIFPDFEQIHINKDVGQVNLLTSDYLKVQPYLLSYNSDMNKDGPVSYIKIKEYFKKRAGNKLDLNIVIFLLLKSRRFKYLNLYHPTFCTQLYTIIFKTINRSGKAYVKLDLDVEHEKRNIEIKEGFFRTLIKSCVFRTYAKLVDVVSVESDEGRHAVSTKKQYSDNKLIKITNGVSSASLLNDYGDVNYEDKKNIFLTIGRIGTTEKCNELMLKALEIIDLNSWVFVFVGPIENSFIQKIEDFYHKNPRLKDSVSFLGPKNRSEICDLYKSAKVFTLSSIREGFPLVFAEASFYGCHIITTAVSGAADITRDGTMGDIIPVGDHVLFSKAMEKIIELDVSRECFKKIRNYANENYTWENIIPKLAKKLTDG